MDDWSEPSAEIVVSWPWTVVRAPTDACMAYFRTSIACRRQYDYPHQTSQPYSNDTYHIHLLFFVHAHSYVEDTGHSLFTLT